VRCSKQIGSSPSLYLQEARGRTIKSIRFLVAVPLRFMTIKLFDNKGTPLQKQKFTWRELTSKLLSKLDDDALIRKGAPGSVKSMVSGKRQVSAGLSLSDRLLQTQTVSRNLVHPRGFEHATPALGGRCSIQLSYGRKRLASVAYEIRPDEDRENCSG